MDIQKTITACFSGHRNLPVAQKQDIIARLTYEISRNALTGYSNFMCGGALGFDTLAARSVIKAKSSYPHIRLILALPYSGQSKDWDEQDKRIYEEIKSRADSVICLGDGYSPGCFQARNRFMVDNASLLIAYCVKSRGGTAYTYHYAIQSGIQRINLANGQGGCSL